MSDELKPVKCGCGGEATVISGTNIPRSFVLCRKCGIETMTFDTEAEAIEAWNTAMGGRPKGEWIDGMEYVNSHWRVCSVCHASAPHSAGGYNFCPNCGARMVRDE